jgi:cytochrome P450
VIGHLAFAESFDCLTNSTYHPWISFISSTLKYVAWVRSLKRININAADFLMRLTPERVRREHAASVDMSKQKVLRRKEKKLEYTDFLSHMISAEEKGQLDMGHLFSNAPIIIIAGSETTATLLSGATFYILKYPRVYDALVREIRSTFQRTSDITLSRLSEAKYLLAVLDETLRMYPPVPTTLPRLTPPQGATILGQYVPGNCIVGVNQYAAFHSPLNFNRPEEFIPERFLSSSDDEWKNDQRDALQPFSFGLRNCVGRK